MDADKELRFSRAIAHFLEQSCVRGAYTIADRALFARFRAFWIDAPEYFDHPALLGQFRVELTLRRFYTSPGGKHPLWHGLTLRESLKEAGQVGMKPNFRNSGDESGEAPRLRPTLHEVPSLFTCRTNSSIVADGVGY